MNIQWQQFLVSISFWIVGEVLLGYIGLDNMIDCAEFLLEQNRNRTLRHSLIMKSKDHVAGLLHFGVGLTEVYY